MATPSGAPPAQTPTAATTTSPDKKKQFIALGAAGVAVLGIGGFLLMRSMGGSAEVAQTPVANAVTAPGTDASVAGGAPGSTLADGGIPPTATQVSTGNNPSTLLPLSPYRRDPFQPFLIFPRPTDPPPPPPTPVPIPTPEPPVFIPQIDAVPIPSPSGGFGGGSGNGSSSGAPSDGFTLPTAGGSSSSDQPFNLPAVVIPRLNSRQTEPTNAFPPPRSSSGAGSGLASPSFDKRLSGVVIGNGVRAVLEINNGSDEPKSYVVQPGDVVEGITVLNIRRYNEGGQQVTRMLIRENGGERTVDLKPGPPRNQGGEFGGAGGPEGFDGDPRGFGGAPRGFGGDTRGFGGVTRGRG